LTFTVVECCKFYSDDKTITSCAVSSSVQSVEGCEVDWDGFEIAPLYPARLRLDQTTFCEIRGRKHSPSTFAAPTVALFRALTRALLKVPKGRKKSCFRQLDSLTIHLIQLRLCKRTPPHFQRGFSISTKGLSQPEAARCCPYLAICGSETPKGSPLSWNKHHASLKAYSGDSVMSHSRNSCTFLAAVRKTPEYTVSV
jgi:hypothetical protein